MERVIKTNLLLETADQVSSRIVKRFPQSGLSRVAAEVVQITKEAVKRAELIGRPYPALRAGLVVLAVTALALIWWEIRGHESEVFTVAWLRQFLDATKGSAAYLGAIAFFIITIEIRLKRRRALKAVHELRAMAHIIDMHQLAKDPERLGSKEEPVLVSGRPMSADDMYRYLHFCSELLAFVSKIGHLYVQNFADAPTLAAVDQFENLATGLSSKIWQKIMLLERLPSDAREVIHVEATTAGMADSARHCPKP